MSRVIDDILFSDIDLKLGMHPITNDVALLKNIEAIKRSVRNLVLTNRDEKPYKPSIYGGILDALFENFDPILVMQLRDAIKTVLQYEPRAADISVDVGEVASDLDKNGINIAIHFRPINSSIGRVTVNVFLERLR